MEASAILGAPDSDLGIKEGFPKEVTGQPGDLKDMGSEVKGSRRSSSRGHCMDKSLGLEGGRLAGEGENVMAPILEMLVDMFVRCGLSC